MAVCILGVGSGGQYCRYKMGCMGCEEDCESNVVTNW